MLVVNNFAAKNSRKFWWFNKGSYLCIPFENNLPVVTRGTAKKAERSLKEWKQQRINFRNLW